MARFPYPDIPDGWYMIALARDANERGELEVPVFGREISLRISDGQVASAAATPLAMRDGVIFGWSHASGAAPSWPPPGAAELTSPDWTVPRCHHFRIRTHPQEIGENTVDTAHLPQLHGMESGGGELELETRGHEMRVRMCIRARGRDGSAIDTHLEAHNIGPGWSTVRMTSETGAESIAVYAYTPRGDGCVDYWILGTLRRSGNDDLDERIAERSHAYQIATVAEDIPIWENKIYRANPMLSESESAIAAYRRWFQQFYSRREAVSQGGFSS